MGVTDVLAMPRLAADKRFLRSPGPAVVGQLGASISNNGTLSYYDKTLSGTVSYGSLNPMGFALPKTKGRFTAGGVAATNGFTTAQMISTHLANVLLSNWDYCIVGEVTNDLGNAVTIATTKANISTIIAALLAKGKIPILTTVPPNDSYASGAGLTWITQYNEWIKKEARRLRVPIVDYHAVLVAAATNVYGAGFTADGTHPTANGAKVMGDALADVLNSLPSMLRSPLAPSYNPNLMIPDVCATSVGSDKIVGSGVTTGGWAFATPTSAKWRGNAPTIVRGSGGDYSIAYPVIGSWIAAHRMRMALGLQTQLTVGSGTWSAYLYNVSQSQVVCGYSAMTHPLDDGTGALATDGSVAATNVVTCATSKPFRQWMVGNPILVLSGVSSRFAAGTVIIGVEPDGSKAYLSNATAITAASQTVVVLGAPQVGVFEFDVQPDMVGDTFNLYLLAAGAAATMISGAQVSFTDLTAIGAA